MTVQEIREAAKVMEAYANGKKIQYLNDDNEWIDAPNPLFDWDNCVYRIKPESQYRPFKSQEECWQEMHKHPDFGWVIRSGVYLNISGVYCDTIYTLEDSNGIHFDYAFLELIFTDGAPFGVKEE